jgi:hypothetical protein
MWPIDIIFFFAILIHPPLPCKIAFFSLLSTKWDERICRFLEAIAIHREKL